MDLFVSQLESRLEKELALFAEEKNAVLRYDRSAKAVRTAVEELTEEMETHPFPGLAEEIRYFRELAPPVYARYFYYFRLFQVESMRACVGPARFREVLDEEVKRIENFLEQNREICRYYYQQARHWDEQLFTRKGREKWTVDELSWVLDRDFCMGSYWVSWIQANERLRGWLERAMAEVRFQETAGTRGMGEGRGLGERRSLGEGPELKWIGSNTDLVELIYGMQLAGSFGDASVKQVARWFEARLGVDLGDFYHTWQEIGRRKKSPTKFIDLMKEKLLEKRDRNL